MEEQLARGPLDLPFLMLTMLLMGIGLIMVFSASYASAYYDPTVSSPLYYIQRQVLFAGAGVVIMLLVSKINYQTFLVLSMPLLVGSIGLAREQLPGEVAVCLGYILRRDRWGRGLAREGAAACLDYAFRELGEPQVAADIRPEKGLLAIRKALGLYANLRPAALRPA